MARRKRITGLTTWSSKKILSLISVLLSRILNSNGKRHLFIYKAKNCQTYLKYKTRVSKNEWSWYFGEGKGSKRELSVQFLMESWKICENFFLGVVKSWEKWSEICEDLWSMNHIR